MNCSEYFEHEIEVLIKCYARKKKKKSFIIYGGKNLKQMSAKKEEDM